MGALGSGDLAITNTYAAQDVDFGTFNSTVAWFDGHQLRFVLVEANSPILPTAIHLSKEYEGTTGTAAIERYVQENAAVWCISCRRSSGRPPHPSRTTARSTRWPN